jgi:hypothetical protein
LFSAQHRSAAAAAAARSLSQLPVTEKRRTMAAMDEVDKLHLKALEEAAAATNDAIRREHLSRDDAIVYFRHYLAAHAPPEIWVHGLPERKELN